MRNGREKKLSNDFTKIDLQFVKEYFCSVTPAVQDKLFGKDARDCYHFLESRWKNNLGINNNPLYAEVDLILLFFSYKLLYNKGDLDVLYSSIQSFCSYYDIKYTRKELDIILMGLFYQNVDTSANPLIEQVMRKSATEDVLFYLSILYRLSLLYYLSCHFSCIFQKWLIIMKRIRNVFYSEYMNSYLLK